MVSENAYKMHMAFLFGTRSYGSTCYLTVLKTQVLKIRMITNGFSINRQNHCVKIEYIY